MLSHEVAAFRKFVDALKTSIDRAEEPDWTVSVLLAEEADDLLPAMRKAADLLEQWHAAEEEYSAHMEDMSDAASY